MQAHSPSPARPASPLGAADRQTLEMLAALRLALSTQIARLLESTERSAAGRLLALERRGLARREATYRRCPVAGRITDAGLRALGLPPRRSAPGRAGVENYRHEVGVAWLWLAARRGTFGRLAAITADPALRAHDRRLAPGQAPLGVGLGTFDWRGRPLRHYPDLLLDRPAGGRVAVELELTRKSDLRLEQILTAYASEPHIGRVLYVAERAGTARALAASATRLGLGELVAVRRIGAGAIPGAPAPERRRSAPAPVLGAER